MLKSKQIASISEALLEETGKATATLMGQVSPGSSMTLSLVLQGAADAQELSASVEAFWQRLRELAGQNGIPIDGGKDQ